MSAIVPEILSAKDLKARRKQILAEIGMAENELRELAEDYFLTVEQYSALEELDDIRFLEGS